MRLYAATELFILWAIFTAVLEPVTGQSVAETDRQMNGHLQELYSIIPLYMAVD